MRRPNWRIAGFAVVVSDLDELGKKLSHAQKLLEKEDCQRIQDRSGIFGYNSPLARPGAGRIHVLGAAAAQYPNMLSDLCRHFPGSGHARFDLADAAYRRMGREPLSRLVFPLPEETARAEAELVGVPAGR